MVDSGAYHGLWKAQLAQISTTLLVRNLPSKVETFPMARWNPRSGRGPPFHRWWTDVKMLLASLGCDESYLQSTHPTLSDLHATSSSMVTRSRDATVDAETLKAETDAYQRINTALYWQVRASLDISGPNSRQDDQYVNLLMAVHS